MIVHDLDIFSACDRPPETDTELIVYADAMLPGAVALERFEPVPGWDTEVFESACDLQLSKLAPRDGLDVYESSNTPAVRESLRVSTPDRYDHRRILSRRVINVKRDGTPPNAVREQRL